MQLSTRFEYVEISISVFDTYTKQIISRSNMGSAFSEDFFSAGSIDKYSGKTTILLPLLMMHLCSVNLKQQKDGNSK